MSKALYKRYLRLLAAWPKDAYKNPNRDYAVHLSRRVEEAFSQAAPVPPDPALCERRLHVLEQIAENRWARQFPHSYESGVFGLKLQQLEEASSDENRRLFGLGPKKGLLQRIFSFSTPASFKSSSS